MHTTSGSRGPTATERVADVWVTEKGLPHPCQRRVAEGLGDHILVATDLGPVSRRIEARAIELAEQTDASLTIVAVCEPGSDTERLDELAETARAHGIPTATRVESGDPVDVLLRLSRDVPATGIIVGDDQWLGLDPYPCICAPLIRLGPLPVLVVHRSPDHACELPA